MADQKNTAGKPVEAASAAPGERRAATPPRLAKASESGNAEVHQALGNLETARLNLAAAKAEGVEDPDAEESARQARARLTELGVE